MSGQIVEPHSGSEPGRLIRLLQDELTATNREVLAMTVELDERVKERTTQFLQANQKLTQEIAERKHAEEEVRKLNQDLADRAVLLEEANHELEAFSYSVSHDLRAPLRHVIGFASILKERGKATLDQEAQGLIECICGAANRMSTLIDALLRFSRLARVQRERRPAGPE
jgi:signal transduction histidine kinase